MSKEAIPHAREFLGDATTQLFLNQVLVALVIRSGGNVRIPASEIDATGEYILSAELDPLTRQFNFKVEKKQ